MIELVLLGDDEAIHLLEWDVFIFLDRSLRLKDDVFLSLNIIENSVR